MIAPKIRSYMTSAPHTIGADQTLAVAHQFMRENHIRHLPVLDGRQLVGLLSQRDLYFIETLAGVVPEEVLVEEAMTDTPFVVDPDASLERVAAEMAKEKYGCAIIADRGEVLGVFTTTDACRALAGLLAERRTVKPAKATPRRRTATRGRTRRARKEA